MALLYDDLRHVFILGAPKCGTTALFDQLSQHPFICAANIKEAYYFCDDFNDALRPIRHKDHYHALFDLEADHQWTLEACPYYLVSEVAIDRILASDADAKLIIMIRNPIDFVFSYHQQMRQSFDEAEADPAKAWALETQRRAGEMIPARCRDPRVLFYKAMADFPAQLKRAMVKLSDENLRIILFDDFVSNPSLIARDLMIWLDLPEAELSATPTNPGRVYQHKQIGYLIERSGTWLPERVRSSSIAKPLRSLRQRLRTAFLQPGYREQKDPELISALHEHFSPQIEELEALLERDLSHWKAACDLSE